MRDVFAIDIDGAPCPVQRLEEVLHYIREQFRKYKVSLFDAMIWILYADSVLRQT